MSLAEEVAAVGRRDVEESYAIAQVIADAVTEAVRCEANGPEVGLFAMAALSDAGYEVVRADRA